MSTPVDTGGFVYPIYLDEDHPERNVIDYGITRRDWLAGLAMSGIVSAGAQEGRDSMHPTTALEVARSAYHVADLMIKISREAGLTIGIPHEPQLVGQTAADGGTERK